MNHPLLVGIAIGVAIGSAGLVAAHIALYGVLARGQDRKASR